MARGGSQSNKAKEKGQWMTLTGRVLSNNSHPHPAILPGSGDSELIGGSRCVSNCREPSARETSLSPLSWLCQEATRPLAASNYRPYLCQSLCLSLSFMAGTVETQGAADSPLNGHGGENNEARQGRDKGKCGKENNKTTYNNLHMFANVLYKNQDEWVNQ